MIKTQKTLSFLLLSSLCVFSIFFGFHEKLLAKHGGGHGGHHGGHHHGGHRHGHHWHHGHHGHNNHWYHHAHHPGWHHPGWHHNYWNHWNDYHNPSHDWYWYGGGDWSTSNPGYYYDPNYYYYEDGTPTIEYEYDEPIEPVSEIKIENKNNPEQKVVIPEKAAKIEDSSYNNDLYDDDEDFEDDEDDDDLDQHVKKNNTK